MFSPRQRFLTGARISKLALASAAAVGLMVGASSASMAAGTLVTLDPFAAGLSSQGAFQADNYQLSDFAKITINNVTGSFSETGTLRLNTFQNGVNNVFSGTSGLENGTGSASYGMYVTFTASGSLASFNVANVASSTFTGSFSNVSYSLLGDPGNTDSLSAAGVLTDNGAVDKLLAQGGLAAGGKNQVTLTNGIPAADILLTLLKTATGNQYFELPTDLSLQEDSFTNTGSVSSFQVVGGQTIVTITSGGGNGTFVEVPEPNTMLILAVGLLGIAGVGYRRRLTK